MKTKRKRVIWSNNDPYNQKIVQEFVQCYPDTDVIWKSGEEITFIDKDGMYYLNEQPLIGLISAYYGRTNGMIRDIIEKVVDLEYVNQLLYSYRPDEHELLLGPVFDLNYDHQDETGQYISTSEIFKKYLERVNLDYPDLQITGVYIESVFELCSPQSWSYYEKSEKADVKQTQGEASYLVTVNSMQER